MADEALGREIRQLRGDLKEDLGEIKAQLGALLPREVYTANHEALKHRVSTLEAELKRAESERVNARRWAIASVVLPVVSLTVMIILAVT
ncbi:hypothetical protein [Glycomyces sp. NPDC021274]|uniref:hypothetical protein n=1 Tax=Glycomyces sp. NPDC021274 TaxID=3155120 RepID=UPI0033F1FBC5